ncbi:hypothetical protein B0H10DRAFT_2231808 [Mycena sp. CBHHK59/15]|nr:hypothetical protein B0H10DRAFT_2231808 [Mycena sp. CBHHK59/15]
MLLSPPLPTFVPERDIPDLSGKVILATGANNAIGYHTVKELLRKGATLEAETQRTARFLELDLADLGSVRKAVTELLEREPELDVINNGGVMSPPTEMLTAQGLDLQFGTNIVGHFFLTELLARPFYYIVYKLQRESSTSPPQDTPLPRRDRESSLLPSMVAPSGMRALPRGDRPHLNGSTVKVTEQHHHLELLRETIPGVIVSCALHPGGIRTELRRYGGGWIKSLKDRLLYPPEMGALTQLWAAPMALPAEIMGQYLIPWARIAPRGVVDPRSSNATLENELVDHLRERVQGY